MTLNRCVKLMVGIPLLSLLGIGCQIHVSGCSVGLRAVHEKTVDLQQALVPGRSVDVETSSGSIRVEGNASDTCQVHAKITVRAKSEATAAQIAEDITILIKQTDTGLEIRADKPRVNNVSISISYEVTVPKETSVVCRSSSGSLKIVDINGHVNARTSSGSVRCEGISGDSASLETSSGSVHLSKARLRTGRLHTSSGSIHVDDIDCPDIHANVSSGSITVACVEGVSAALKADLQTSSGSVTLTVPRTYQGQVDLSTNSGNIHSDLPVTVQGSINKRHLIGTVGQGAGTIRLKSSSGSVRLKTT